MVKTRERLHFTLAQPKPIASVKTTLGIALVRAPKIQCEKGAKADNLKREILPVILKNIIAGKDVPVKILAERVDHTTPNYIGTLTGDGKGVGLGLWKKGSAIHACRENVGFAVDFLYFDVPENERLARVAADVEMSEVELQDAIEKLPSAQAEKDAKEAALRRKLDPWPPDPNG